MSEAKEKMAVMLLAHGTKEPEASEPVHQYAKALADSTGLWVEPCLREFIEPSVPTVVQKMVSKGAKRIVVVPFFLFKSGHVSRDITNDLAREEEKHPEVHFEVGEPIGYDERLLPVLKNRLEELLKKTGSA